MSPYGVTPDDESLDVVAVGADDQLVETLRRSLSPDAAVIWDDDDEADDPAFALLRALQLDVSDDLPADAPILPATVTPLAGRRRLGRGATVAAVSFGVLSIAGVAAASAPGQPLAGVRHSVSAAVAGVVDAITPDAPVGPSVLTPAEGAKPSPSATPPGQLVSAAARSTAAVLQIEANLDRAAVLLQQGRYAAAQAQLDAAARKLTLVSPSSTRDALAARLAALQDRLDARAGDASTGRIDDGDLESSRDASTDTEGNEPAGRPTAPPERSDGAGPSTKPSGVSEGRGSDDAPAVETPSRSEGSGYDDAG